MSEKTTSSASTKGSSPEFTASHRSVSAGVYRKQVKNDDGSVDTLFNVDLRRYYHKGNERKHTHVLGESDVPFALQALQECYAYAVEQRRVLRKSKPPVDDSRSGHQ